MILQNFNDLCNYCGFLKMQQKIWQQTDVLNINLLENLLYYIFF